MRAPREARRYLKGCFRKEGCRPLEVHNHILAIIDQRSLDAVMRNSGISSRDLLTNQPNDVLVCPELVFPAEFRLEYLLDCIGFNPRESSSRQETSGGLSTFIFQVSSETSYKT